MNVRSYLLFVLPLLAGAAFIACGSVPHAAERLNQDGNRQYAARDYAGALETYRRAEVLRPDLPALNYNAANTLNQQSDFQRAVSEDQQAIHSTDPAVQDRAYYSMGNAYVRTNQLREAVDAYKSALRVNPSDMDAKYNLEVIERKLGQEEARQQPQPGQDQSGRSQQGQDGQQAQPGQGQAGAQGQDGQPQAGQAAGASAGQPSGATGNGTASGYTGTPAGQAAALDPDLKRALDQFDRTGNVDDALRALDIAAQQEQTRQQQAQQTGGGGPAQSQGRDW